MIRCRRIFPAILLTLLTLLAGLLACGDGANSTNDGGVVATGDLGAQPEQTFYDYRLIETDGGIRRWVLDSDLMLKYTGRQDVDLVRVNMDFFRDGKYYSTLVADSGVADTRTHDVHVWGHVTITTDDDRRLRTTDLRYTNEDGLIRNEVYNVFDRGADVVTGIGLEATPDLDYLVIKEQVAGVIGDDAAADTGSDSNGDRP